MLTKKQRWRRVRTLRSNSASSFSSTGSSGSIGGGSNGDTREAFPASASGRMAESETETAAAEAAAAAAVPDDTTDGPTSTPPPPPLPPPQQRAPPAPPHEPEPGLGPDTAKRASREGASGPSTTPPRDDDLRQEHQHQHQPLNNFCGGTGNAAAPHHHAHPLNAWRISALNLLKLLFFFDDGGNDHGRGFGGGWSGGGPANRDRAATEGCRALGAVSSARPRHPSEPVPLPPRPRVRFSHQIRVILVASRGEMSSVKADVWWGEKDYCNFRRAYLTAVREKKALDRDTALKSRPDGAAAAVRTSEQGEGRGDFLHSPEPSASAPSSAHAATASPGNDERADVGGEDVLEPRVSREQEGPSPRAPPPSPEGAAHHPPRAGEAFGGRGRHDRGGDVGAGRGAVLGLDRLEGKSEAPTTKPVEVGGATVEVGSAAIAMSAPGSTDDAVPTRPGRESILAEDDNKKPAPAVVLATPVPTTPCTTSASVLGGFEPARKQDPSIDVAAVARGFPWRVAGTRAEVMAVAAAGAAARRSPGSSVVAAKRASTRALGDGGGGGGGGGRSGGDVRWKRPRGEPTIILETGRDLRVDPRTGGRLPLPFLGEAPIRRVASF